MMKGSEVMTIYISTIPTNTMFLVFLDLAILNACRYLVIENTAIYWG